MSYTGNVVRQCGTMYDNVIRNATLQTCRRRDGVHRRRSSSSTLSFADEKLFN